MQQNNRAISIVRVSTTEQAHEERFSIPHQKTHILEECRHRNLDMVHFFEFVQSGAKVLSDSSKERTEIIKFLQDHNIGVVIVHELDRLARSMIDTLLFVDQLNKLDVTFVSIHDGFDTSTAQGQLQMHILAAFAEYFRKQLASKVIGGMVERAKQGKHLGQRPLGYNVGPAGFEINKNEAKIIRMIYSMYIEQNLGLRAIADQLNGMGLKTQRGNAWSHVSVRDILENETYTGTFVWSDIRVKDNHPPIIDQKTWDDVQERRKRKKGLGGRAQNSFYLLSGLLRCGVCNGSTMVGRHARKGKYHYRYYTCNNYASRGVGTCSSGYIRADKLEKLIVDDIRDFTLSESTEINRHTIPSDVTLVKEKIELKRKELATFGKMLTRAAEAYEKGMYDLDWFSERKNQIMKDKAREKEEIENLEKYIQGVISEDEMAKKIKEKRELAKSFLNERDQIKAKAKLQQFIDHIEVINKDEVGICYRI